MLTLLMLAPTPGQADSAATPAPAASTAELSSDPSYDDRPPVKHQGVLLPGSGIGVNLNKIGDPVANSETPSPPDFSLTESSPSLTLLVGTGGNGSSTISVAPINGFASDVTLGVSGGYGVSASLSQSTITLGSGSSTLNVTVAPGTPGGIYFVTVYGSGGGISHSVTYTVYVSDFSLSANPGNVTVPLGGSGAGKVAVNGLYGFSSSVSLSASGLPSGVSASFSPSVVTATGSSTLTLNIGAASHGGVYPLTVTGTYGGATLTTTLTLTISDFLLSVTSPTLSLPDSSTGTVNVSMTGMYGFGGTAALSASGLPSGVTAAFSPTSQTAGGTSVLTLTVGPNVPLGTYPVTLTGTYSGSYASVPRTTPLIDRACG